MHLSFHILLTACIKPEKGPNSFHNIQQQVAPGYFGTEKVWNRRWAFIPLLTNFPHMPWLQKWISPIHRLDTREGIQRTEEEGLGLHLQNGQEAGENTNLQLVKAIPWKGWTNPVLYIIHNTSLILSWLEAILQIRHRCVILKSSPDRWRWLANARDDFLEHNLQFESVNEYLGLMLLH